MSILEIINQVVMEIRKVLFPINLKLTFAVLLLTALSLTSYIWLAIDSFRTDKIAYVFETVESQNNQVTTVIEEQIQQLNTFHKIFQGVGANSLTTAQIFDRSPFLISYKDQNGNIYGDKKIWNQINLSKNNKNNYQYINLSQKKLLIERLHLNKSETILVADLNQILNLIPASRIYEFNLIIADKILKDSSVRLTDNFESIGKQTKVINDHIVSFRPFLQNMIFFTVVDYNKALEAATTLTKKSLYFGILVAGMVILFILFLSARLTSPIKKLYSASLELSKANFNHRVKINDHSEIGVLGDSFNYMAQEIQKYLEEMKEKNRLENEIKTAKLVQKSFFPTNEIKTQRCHLKAFYQPASECGGDWWGHISTATSDIVIILDVTGHGTAAALMTAMMHNTLNSLKTLGKKDKEYQQNPAQIMDFLNQSFSSVNNNLFATAFVLVIKDGKLSYTNASHNPPLLIKASEKSITKQDLHPLNQALGARIGESLESKYSSEDIELGSNDQIILYTDGILEATNSTGKAFGSRNFFKSITKSYNPSHLNSVEIVTSDLYDFLGKEKPLDDVTLLTVKLGCFKVFEDFKGTSFEQQYEKMGIERTLDASLADIVLYDEKISECISNLNIGVNLSHILSKEDFANREQVLTPRKVNFLQNIKTGFSAESVKEVSEIIDKTISQIIQDDAFSEIKRYLKQTSLELIQNALVYKKVQNLEGEILYTLARDEQHYIVEVQDPFGKLNPTHILQKAQRAFIDKTYEMKEEGAGLGFSMIIIASDEVSIQVKNNEYTKIRCIIGKHKRLKDFRQKNNAIYINKG